MSALALAIATVGAFTADSRSFGQSLALPDNTAKVRKLAFRYDVRDYGAVAGDGADDAAAIQLAINAAYAAGGGTVIFGPGIYDITTGLTVTSDTVPVSFEGADSTTVIRARAASSWSTYEAMLKIPGPDSGVGNRYGHVKDIRFNGNDLAQVGLHLQNLVEWSIVGIDVTSCERVGRYDDGIQNCTFIANRIQRNGSGTLKGSINATPATDPDPYGYGLGATNPPFDDANVVVDHGAGNNHHYFEQMSEATDPAPADGAVYQLILCQSSESDVAGGYPPQSNTWHGGQIERSATNQAGLVLQSAGKLNTLHDVTFYVGVSKPIITVSRQIDTGLTGAGSNSESNTLTLSDCRFTGLAAATPVLVKADTTNGDACLIVNPYMENIDVFAQVASATNVAIEGNRRGGEPATFVTNINDWTGSAGSAETVGSLVNTSVRKYPTFPAGAPPDGTNYGTGGFVANHSLWSVYDQGQWRNIYFNPTTRTNLTYGTTVTPSATEGVYQKVVVTNGTGWTLAAPPSTLPGKFLVLEIANGSGGAMGTVTFNAAYDLDAAWSAPADEASVILTFACDGTTWHEVARTPASGGGMTNPMTTEGDLILGGSSGTPGRLAIGTSGQVLKSNGTTAAWGTDSTGAGGGIVTVKENGLNAGGSDDDIQVLDLLGADFDTTESPDQEINVVIAAALTRDAEWDTSSEIATAVGDETGSGALVFGTAPTISTVELGHATDTTLARSSAGVVTIETVPIVTTTATQTLTNKTLTSPVISGGGTINSAVIGGTTPAAGTFTTLSANTGLQLYDSGNSAYGLIYHINGTYHFETFESDAAPIICGAIDATSLTVSTDLTVANGGTGASTHTSGNWLKGAGTSAITSFTPGTGVETAATNAVDGASGLVTFDTDLNTLKTAFSTASSSAAAYLDLAEDTDNGSNRVRLSGAQSAADVTVTLPAATDTLVGKATTDTLTNKRITPRVQSVTSAATVTPAGDSDDMVKVTAQAEAVTFAAPTGTPTEGQRLTVRIKDNGTARGITWNVIYRNCGATPPTTTVLSKTTYVGFVFNETDTKWDCIAVSTQP